MRLHGPLLLDDELLGVVEIIVSAEQLIAVTEDYTGLGKSGEVTLAKHNISGDALFLTPLRFDVGAALTRAVAADLTDNPMTHALMGDERVFVAAETVDYRSTPIFAVTRYIPAVEWGLVAKIDRKEALADATAFRNTFLLIALLTVFVIIGLSLLISNTLATPLIRLTFHAKALRDGDFTSKIQLGGKDEIGSLATAFNEMSQQIETSYETLESKVRQRTKSLEQAKAKDEAMLSSIGEGLVATDEKGKIVLVNKVFEQLLGWQAKDVYGKQLTAVISMIAADGTSTVPVQKRLIAQALEKRVVMTSTTPISFKRKDGGLIPVTSTVSPIMVGKKQIGAVMVFRDTTKEREIDQAKTEFVSLASHQLRTPLSIVNWYTEMLLAGDIGKVTKEQHKYLVEIYQGNKRMVDLVNALLNVSRLELGTFVVEPVPTDLVKLVRQVMDENKVLFDEKQIKLSDSFEKVPEVQVDPKLFTMVIQNLLSNAIKYTPEKGKIVISIAPENEKTLLLKIADTGYGIPKKQQDKIFSKLFRADNVLEKDTEGTGLGLYIVKAIIDHSGGTIRFESAENKGTTFFITLPITGMKKKAGTTKLLDEAELQAKK